MTTLTDVRPTRGRVKPDVQSLPAQILWWSRGNSSGTMADNTGHGSLSTGI